MKLLRSIGRSMRIGFAEMNRKLALLWLGISLSAGLIILLPSVTVGSKNYFISISGNLLYFYIMWQLPVWFPLYAVNKINKQ